MKEIAENTYQIGLMAGTINVYLIDHDSGMVLIDTGTSPDAIDHVVRSVAKLNRKMTDIRHILITHAHFDHVGGLVTAQKQTQAKTYAHRREAMIIKGEQPVVIARRENLRGLAWLMHPTIPQIACEPTRVEVMLQDGDSLDAVLPGLTAIELPGHTYGQMGYWWQGILFGGDVMMHYPWGLRMPLAAASPDWDAAKQSVRKVAAMDVKTLCVGHGVPIVGDAATKIRSLAERII